MFTPHPLSSADTLHTMDPSAKPEPVAPSSTGSTVSRHTTPIPYPPKPHCSPIPEPERLTDDNRRKAYQDVLDHFSKNGYEIKAGGRRTEAGEKSGEEGEKGPSGKLTDQEKMYLSKECLLR